MLEDGEPAQTHCLTLSLDSSCRSATGRFDLFATPSGRFLHRDAERSLTGDETTLDEVERASRELSKITTILESRHRCVKATPLHAAHLLRSATRE